MKLRFRRLISAASVAAACGICAASAHAQTATFGAGVGTYALLNGDNLTVYLDRLGDIGAPRTTGVPAKPGGDLNGSNQPFINPDGSVDTSTKARAYGLLYNNASQSGQPLQTSIQNKDEYLTLGTNSPVEGWSVKVGTTWHPYSTFANTGLSTIGGSIDGPLSATTVNSLATLQVSQTLSFNQAGGKNIAAITMTFQNNGTGNLTGLQYARLIDPNQDEGPGGSNSVQTNQTASTSSTKVPGDPTLFGINSTGSASGRNLAIGVHGSDMNAVGTDIYAISGSTPEATALTTPTTLLNGVNYIQLTNATGGASFTDRTNPANDGTTTNWQTTPFTNGDLNVAPTAFGTDTDMELLSPLIGSPNAPAGTLLPGAANDASYTFYYVFGPPNPISTVPEPGSLALLAGSGLAMASSRLVARRRSK